MTGEFPTQYSPLCRFYTTEKLIFRLLISKTTTKSLGRRLERMLANFYAATIFWSLTSCASCPCQDCSANSIAVHTIPSGSEIISISLGTSVQVGCQILVVEEEKAAEIVIWKSWTVAPPSDFTSEQCSATLDGPIVVELNKLLYRARIVRAEDGGAHGQDDNVVVNLEFNGKMYVPTLGWNEAHDIYCSEDVRNNEVVCTSLEPG